MGLSIKYNTTETKTNKMKVEQYICTSAIVIDETLFLKGDYFYLAESSENVPMIFKPCKALVDYVSHSKVNEIKERLRLIAKDVGSERTIPNVPKEECFNN